MLIFLLHDVIRHPEHLSKSIFLILVVILLFTFLRIRIRSEKPFTFVLEVYQNVSGQGNSLVLNETIGRIVSEIRRLLSEQEDFRRFRTREQVEDFYQGGMILFIYFVNIPQKTIFWEVKLSLSSFMDLVSPSQAKTIYAKAKWQILHSQWMELVTPILFQYSYPKGPWNITYYDQLGNEYTIFPTVSPHTERIFINTSKVYSLESPEMHTPMYSPIL